MDEAIAIILRDCLSQFLGNLPALESGDAVEAVHQMRVAMRRLRSALGLFNRVFPLQPISRPCGPRRSGSPPFWGRRATGTCSSTWFAPVLSRASATSPGSTELLAAAQAKADAGHAAVLQLANARAATRFALSLERLASGRGWRSATAEDRLLGLAEPVVAFAARSLDRLDRKLRKRGRHFRSLSPEARHALRIAMKHMRYATEFFGHLFHPASGGRALRRQGRGAAGPARRAQRRDDRPASGQGA